MNDNLELWRGWEGSFSLFSKLCLRFTLSLLVLALNLGSPFYFEESVQNQIWLDRNSNEYVFANELIDITAWS